MINLGMLIKNNYIMPAVSVWMYALSLILPGLYHGNHADLYGYAILVSGAAGVFVENFAWFANLFYAGSLLMLLEEKLGIYVAQLFLICAIFFALTSFSIVGANMGGSGPTDKIYAIGPGFWLWLSSFVVLLVYAVAKTIWIKKKKAVDQESRM